MTDEQQTSQALGLTFDFWGVKCRVLSVHKPDIAHIAYYFGDFMIKPEPPDLDVFLQTGNPEKSFIEHLSDPATEKKILFRTGEDDWQVWETFTTQSRNPALVPPFYLAPLLDRVFLLHGAALSSPKGKGLVIFGAPKSGKTLISIALGQKGFGILADDQIVYDFKKETVLAYRRPFGIRENTWKLLGLEKKAPEGAARLETPEGTTIMVRAADLGLDVSVKECQPALALFLNNEDAGKPSIKDLPQDETRKLLLENTLSIPEQHIAHVEALAKTLPAKKISYRLTQDWQAVADMIFELA